jgi:predicted DNA-binding transcriptional regulator AlpA
MTRQGQRRAGQRPKFYRYSQLANAGIPWSRKHVNHLEKNGRFPQRVWLGENTCAWPCDEIDDYVEARIRERRFEVRMAGRKGRKAETPEDLTDDEIQAPV